jgi:hypothetical protein
MRIRILRDRRFVPPDSPRMAVQYPKGLECTVKRAWGDALVEDGDAEEIETPSRDDDEAET